MVLSLLAKQPLLTSLMHECTIFHVITNLMNVILIWQGPPGRDGLRGFKGYKVCYWHFFFFFRCFNLLLLSEIAWNVLFVIFLENYFLNQYFLREKMFRFFHFIGKQKLILVTDEIHHSTWLLCFEMRPSFYNISIQIKVITTTLIVAFLGKCWSAWWCRSTRR